MNNFLICASVLILTACASTPDSESDAPLGKVAVVQVGTKQNTELVFCETDKCPGRTPKYLPAAPKKVQLPVVPKPVAPVVVPAPKQTHFKVHFRWGSGKLDAAGRKELEKVKASGLLNDAKAIVVAGRTDPTGSIKFNKKLALERAESVKAALVKSGFPSNRITAEAQAPCCDGDLRASKEAMQELRRTDIDITITTK